MEVVYGCHKKAHSFPSDFGAGGLCYLPSLKVAYVQGLLIGRGLLRCSGARLTVRVNMTTHNQILLTVSTVHIPRDQCNRVPIENKENSPLVFLLGNKILKALPFKNTCVLLLFCAFFLCADSNCIGRKPVQPVNFILTSSRPQPSSYGRPNLPGN